MWERKDCGFNLYKESPSLSQANLCKVKKCLYKSREELKQKEQSNSFICFYRIVTFNTNSEKDLDVIIDLRYFTYIVSC